MKKYFYAIAALVLVAGISAFNNKEKTASVVSMYYHGPSFNQADVQNKSYWNTSPQECIEGEERACQVTVDASFVQNGAFTSSISLEAEAGSDAALIDVKNSGSSISPDILNRE